MANWTSKFAVQISDSPLRKWFFVRNLSLKIRIFRNSNFLRMRDTTKGVSLRDPSRRVCLDNRVRLTQYLEVI